MNTPCFATVSWQTEMAPGDGGDFPGSGTIKTFFQGLISQRCPKSFATWKAITKISILKFPELFLSHIIFV